MALAQFRESFHLPRLTISKAESHLAHRDARHKIPVANNMQGFVLSHTGQDNFSLLLSHQH